MRSLDLITGARKFNQFLKLIKEHGEQKILIEEKESLKASVVSKRREDVLSPRPKM